jgi:TIR domain
MPRVFLSHSTEDREFVEQEIIRLLEGCGVETWYSNDSIQPMDQWERSILQGLKSCDVFLMVMSPRSAQSPWVKREVDWVFFKGGKRIIPVLMEECDPDDFHFGTWTWWKKSPTFPSSEEQDLDKCEGHYRSNHPHCRVDQEPDQGGGTDCHGRDAAFAHGTPRLFPSHPRSGCWSGRSPSGPGEGVETD